MINNFLFFKQRKKCNRNNEIDGAKKYRYNIGVGLDANLLLCLNNGFADQIWSILIIIWIIGNLDIFPFDLMEWYFQYQRTDSDTENYLSLCCQTHDAADKKNPIKWTWVLKVSTDIFTSIKARPIKLVCDNVRIMPCLDFHATYIIGYIYAWIIEYF